MPGVLRGVASHLSPAAAEYQAAAAASPANSMDYTTLPHTDLSVSRLCLGCQQFSSAGATSLHKIWDSMEEDTALATITAALDNGINCESREPQLGSKVHPVARLITRPALRSARSRRCACPPAARILPLGPEVEHALCCRRFAAALRGMATLLARSLRHC